ncbi:hypothetical protein SAMN02910297_01610 [Methanobrevibacter olleyae]|uniref:Uncharacterized protein n=1 Tax=Methanobrevibacter olleyae TaxID=294671 RepID=A0A1I4K1P1_METOL|nr:hypothetical protein [Methanobrevibacter olleyae]SFL72481.1 hypothetical protein SAMN02910297_01610 [Methanobrevibacter olleyae]
MIFNLIFNHHIIEKDNKGYILVEGTFSDLFDEDSYDEEYSHKVLAKDVLFIKSFVNEIRNLSRDWLGSIELVKPPSDYDFTLKFNFVDKLEDIESAGIKKYITTVQKKKEF